MKYIYNNPQLKTLRKSLRNNATEAEVMLWDKLKGSQLDGYKFVRQYSVEKYILDFYCPKYRLGIELDGGHHLNPEIQSYDEIRTLNIEQHDIKIIRFQNQEVTKNIDNVLSTIYYNLKLIHPKQIDRK